MLRSVVDDQRRVVLVGDYVNRGANSKAVLSLLAEAKRRLRSNLILLAGNHDIATLRYIDEGSLASYAARGGVATIRSYVSSTAADPHLQFRRCFPREHERLLREELEVFFESDELLVSHTGYDPRAPQDRSAGALVNTPHPELLSDLWARLRAPKARVVFGHYVQASHRPWREDGLVCLDTGCGTVNGPLTALLLPENSFVSV
jgi:serine/threonine protein phosphatase 1